MNKITLLTAAALITLSGSAFASQQLAQSKACMSCHQVAKKVVGPAFQDVAKKYKGDAKAEAHIIGVIKNGSKGVWGAVPMAKQPQANEADAAALAKWIMSL
jgi:cytochrome c